MRLRRSDLSQPGISRRRRGRGFSYTLRDKPVRDPDTLERIRALAVPPAWTEVWISPDERGHIQAIGVDAAGRRQYRYQWRAQRDRRKFAHLADLAAALPRLRDTVAEDLSGRGLTRRRVLAAAVRLLDRTAVRVGGEQYAVDDAEVAAVVRSLLRRTDAGEELLAYREGKAWRDVRSDDVNDYLREVAGAEVTAKDFRTWHGTVAALVSLCAAGRCRTVTAHRKAVATAMREAAGVLGDTPAVARASYVDPRLIDAFGARGFPTLKGLVGTAEDPADAAFADAEVWAQAEKLAIDILT